jgi:hypothetical protein
MEIVSLSVYSLFPAFSVSTRPRGKGRPFGVESVERPQGPRPRPLAKQGVQNPFNRSYSVVPVYQVVWQSGWGGWLRSRAWRTLSLEASACMWSLFCPTRFSLDPPLPPLRI